MKSPVVDCLCIGNIVADHVCAPVDKLPRAGELVMTRKLSLSIGGCASNVAVDLAKLGLRSAVVGRVGTDPLGQYLRDALTAAGVDATHVKASPEDQTSATLVINVAGEDRRFIHDLGGNAALDGSSIPDELIRGCRAVYLGGFTIMPRLTGADVARVFRTARQSGIPTVLDVVLAGPEVDWNNLATALKETDVFLPNVDEGRLLTGSDDPWKQADRFLEAGAQTVVITLGGAGAILCTNKFRLRAHAHSVPFVDGTGSGDAFAAGFISGLLEQLPPEVCLQRGSALGASCVRMAGATTGVFNLAELQDYLQSHPLKVERLG